MKDITYILAFISCCIGAFTDNIATVGLAIFVILQLIYFELKKLKDK